MELVVDCTSDAASRAVLELTRAGCEFKVLTPKQVGAFELITTIIVPATLTAVQIFTQLWLEFKTKKQEVKIYLDGKEFLPTPEEIERLKSKL